MGTNMETGSFSHRAARPCVQPTLGPPNRPFVLDGSRGVRSLSSRPHLVLFFSTLPLVYYSNGVFIYINRTSLSSAQYENKQNDERRPLGQLLVAPNDLLAVPAISVPEGINNEVGADGRSITASSSIELVNMSEKGTPVTVLPTRFFNSDGVHSTEDFNLDDTIMPI